MLFFPRESPGQVQSLTSRVVPLSFRLRGVGVLFKEGA